MSVTSKALGVVLVMVWSAALPAWAQDAPAPQAPTAPERVEPPPSPEASPAPLAPKAPLAPLAPLAPKAPEPPAALTELTARERDEAVHMLESTLEETRNRVEELSDEAWNWKPAEDRWSIAEVVEHIVLVEAVFDTLEAALAAPADPDWQVETAGKESRIYSFMPDRSRKAQAPDFAVPQGGRDRPEMLETLASSRAAWVERLEAPGTAWKAHTAPHPAFGSLNLHQWMLFIGLHHLRHNLQIVEVMAEPGFPH